MKSRSTSLPNASLKTEPQCHSTRRAALGVGAHSLGVFLAGMYLPTFAAPTNDSKVGEVHVRDALHRTIRLQKPPERIVTIFSSNTELVTSLGLTERIVGVEDFIRYPPEVMHLPKVGGRLGFSVDAVVAQRPDLVIVTPARQAANQLVQPMERIGVPILVLLSRNLQEVLDNIRLIGRACSVSERAEVLVTTLMARLQAVNVQVINHTKPRALMVTGRAGNGMLLLAKPGTYTGDAIESAGAQHAMPNLGVLSQVSPEAVLAADPDVLLFAGTDTALNELISQRSWRDMRAVQRKKAWTVSRSEFLIPGPRTFDGIESLAKLLHPV